MGMPSNLEWGSYATTEPAAAPAATVAIAPAAAAPTRGEPKGAVATPPAALVPG